MFIYILPPNLNKAWITNWDLRKGLPMDNDLFAKLVKNGIHIDMDIAEYRAMSKQQNDMEEIWQKIIQPKGNLPLLEYKA
jgi:hypothetical protein